MARSTQNPKMTTRSTIIYETVSPGAAGINIYILYGSKYTVRVVQTHTVGFYGPFRSRSVTLLPDPTTLGKPDFQSRTLVRRRDSLGLGLSSKIHPKVHGRVPWANPFTIRPFSGVPHYYWDAGLTRTHSELGYLLNYPSKVHGRAP